MKISEKIVKPKIALTLLNENNENDHLYLDDDGSVNEEVSTVHE